LPGGQQRVERDPGGGICLPVRLQELEVRLLADLETPLVMIVPIAQSVLGAPER